MKNILKQLALIAGAFALSISATNAAISLTVVTGATPYTSSTGSALTTGFLKYGGFNETAFNALSAADQKDYATVNALFTEVGTVTAASSGSFTSAGNSFSLPLAGSLASGTKLYTWVFNTSDVANATEYGIFSSVSTLWNVAPDLGTTTLTTSVPMTQVFGGSSTLNLASVIPEPSTYALLVGALALGFVAIRRRK